MIGGFKYRKNGGIVDLPLSVPWHRLWMINTIVTQGCGDDRVFIGVDSDSGVGVLMSTPTPTPTPGPTLACLELIALCNLQFRCRNIKHVGTLNMNKKCVC